MVGRAHELDEVLGPARRQANSYRRLAHAARSTGDLDTAVELCQRALEGFLARDDPTAVAHARSTLGDVARLRGGTARRCASTAQRWRVSWPPATAGCTASTHKNLGQLAARSGEHERAARLYLDSLQIRHLLGDDAGLAECLEGLAGCALATGLAPRAATMLAASANLRSTSGAAPLREDRSTLDCLTDDIRAALNDESFERAWAAGLDLDVDGALSLATGLVH